VLVPDGVPTSLGSGIFALLAAGVFPSIEAAQQALCLPFKTFTPQAEATKVYDQLFRLYADVYFSFGQRNSTPARLGEVLPELRKIASQARAV
jgi:L-ribulokinase